MVFLGLFGPDFRSMERNKEVEKLTEYLKNDSISVRTKSCEALNRIGDKRAILPLIDLLNEKKMKGDPKQFWLPDELIHLRFAAIRTLYKLYTLEKNEDQRILKVLIDELNFPKFTVGSGYDNCEEAIDALKNISNNDAKKALISIAYETRYREYAPKLQDFLKDAFKNPELLPFITEAKQKSSESTKERISSDVLSRILPDQTLNAFSIVQYTSATATTDKAEKLIATVAATAVLGSLGGMILGGGGNTGFKTGIIGCSDKEFFLIDFFHNPFVNQNGFFIINSSFIDNFIKRIPLKALKMDFNESSGILLISGALNLQCIIGDFVNYKNLENAHFIINAIIGKNAITPAFKGNNLDNPEPKNDNTTLKTDTTVSSIEISKDNAQKMTEAYQYMLNGVNFEKEKNWYLAISEHERAINAALENDPNRMIYYTNLGVCYAQIGNKNRALENFENAIRIDPNYQRASENLEAISKRNNQDNVKSVFKEEPVKLKSTPIDPVNRKKEIVKTYRNNSGNFKYECTACHLELSEPAKKCPTCGGPVIGMKKD